jgi:hypothetical protein
MGKKIKEIIKDSKSVYLKNYGLCYQLNQTNFDRLRNIAKIDAISWFVGTWGLEYIIAQADLEEKASLLESLEIN